MTAKLMGCGKFVLMTVLALVWVSREFQLASAVADWKSRAQDSWEYGQKIKAHYEAQNGCDPLEGTAWQIVQVLREDKGVELVPGGVAGRQIEFRDGELRIERDSLTGRLEASTLGAYTLDAKNKTLNVKDVRPLYGIYTRSGTHLTIVFSRGGTPGMPAITGAVAGDEVLWYLRQLD